MAWPARSTASRRSWLSSGTAQCGDKDGELRRTSSSSPGPRRRRVATYDLSQLYDGELTAQPSSWTQGHDEEGLDLHFETLAATGAFDLLGDISIPWTANEG